MWPISKIENQPGENLTKKLTPLKYMQSNQDVQAIIVLLCTNVRLIDIIFYFTVSFFLK